MNNVETAQINKEGALMPIGYKVLVESNSSYPDKRLTNLEIIKLMWNMYHVNAGYDMIKGT